MSDGTWRRLAAAVLVAHQRDASSGCICGWSVLGASWAEHVAQVLADAGAIKQSNMSPDDEVEAVYRIAAVACRAWHPDPCDPDDTDH